MNRRGFFAAVAAAVFADAAGGACPQRGKAHHPGPRLVLRRRPRVYLIGWPTDSRRWFLSAADGETVRLAADGKLVRIDL